MATLTAVAGEFNNPGTSKISQFPLKKQMKVGYSTDSDDTDALLSPYRGSTTTYEMVKQQIQARYGKECAEKYDPRTDAMPLISWMSYGFKVRKGEKALKSVTYVEVKNDAGEVIKKIRRVVNLFHKRQIEKMA